MEHRDRRDDWTLLIAIGLIAVGAWLLLERLLGNWFPLAEIARAIGSVFWPLALIAAGLLLYFGGRNRTRVAPPIVTVPGAEKRLYRSKTDRMIGGVLGGLGEYLGVDSTWLRIGFVVLALAANVFPAVLLYIVAMIVVPDAPPAGATQPQWPQGPEQPAPPAPPAAPEPPAVGPDGSDT